MQKGQIGNYHRPDGGVTGGVVRRVRGGNQVDLHLPHGDEMVQMVAVGTGPGEFWPLGFDPPAAPPPKAIERAIPRYIPTWHALLIGVPVAAGTSVLVNLLWNWLTN